MRGALGFSVLRIWPMFGSVFQFSHLKTAVFRFADFSNLVIGFHNEDGFSGFFPVILRFS